MVFTASTNYVQWYFIGTTLAITVLGSLVNFAEHHLPSFIGRSFRYGKFAATTTNDKKQLSSLNNRIIEKLEVPKEWFKHFYILGIISYAFLFRLVVNSYIYASPLPEWIIPLLDNLCGDNRVPTVSKNDVLVSLTLLSLQVFRRFYDTHFVSIFSSNGRMNLTHYLIGLVYYPAALVALLCAAPNFTSSDLDEVNTNSYAITNIKYVNYGFVLLFLWAWYHQHTTTVILANLRKNKGVIFTQQHKVPHGDWFNYLSSPHSTAEILMYTAITWFQLYNVTWWTVYLWVIANQVETMLLSHWWYQKTFKNFPKKRKALIPYLY